MIQLGLQGDIADGGTGAGRGAWVCRALHDAVAGDVAVWSELAVRGHKYHQLYIQYIRTSNRPAKHPQSHTYMQGAVVCICDRGISRRRRVTD
jgi:hypothetical protein